MKYPVLIPNIFDHPFTYESSLKLKTGEYVDVPFGRKTITGVVWDQFDKNANKKFEIKSVKKKLNIEPLKQKTVDFLNGECVVARIFNKKSSLFTLLRTHLDWAALLEKLLARKRIIAIFPLLLLLMSLRKAIL